MSTLPHHDDADRYARLRLIRWWDQDRLRAAKVLVVGAGAIGNEVLKNLALVGIGHMVVVDFDTIEDSNLARCVLFRAADRGESKAQVAGRALQQLNPDVDVRAINGNVLTDVYAKSTKNYAWATGDRVALLVGLTGSKVFYDNFEITGDCKGTNC